MRNVRFAVPAFALASMLMMGAGCESKHEAGVKSNYRTQWTSVAADTKHTTSAAEAVLEGESLKDVVSQSTDVDGVASGKKADGTLVKASIQKNGSGSQVSVTVGTVGDPALGAELARKIKQRAEGM